MTFLKWVGGKTGLIPELKEYFPNFENINGYIECFIGGGSIFFYLKENMLLERKQVYLSDNNPELINCYKAVRDDLNELLSLLDIHAKKHNEIYYNNTKKIYPPGNELTNVEKAAYFIYLNKTCFNGLWRVNSKGKFNVPIGHKEKVNLYDRSIYDDSQNLKGIHLNVMSFENIVNINGGKLKDWFCYSDPPYFSIGIGKNNFTGYTKDSFGLTLKTKLRPVFQQLDKLGCKIMMSNSNSSLIEKEYKDYVIKKVKAKRMINSDGNNRGPIDEYVVMNYSPIERQKDITNCW